MWTHLRLEARRLAGTTFVHGGTLTRSKPSAAGAEAVLYLVKE
jgi:hypothetical protein